MKKIVIAIDGYAGCGKSTTAKGVARRLGYLYIDSGAMYRAITLFLMRHDIPFDTENESLLFALPGIKVEFATNPNTGLPEVLLNGEAVENEIRKPEVAANVSQVSVHPSVRRAMVKLQQEIGKDKGIVMDGRDIGTVVFPEAELKVFMTADVEVRALRRQAELLEKGIHQDLEEIVFNLKNRDKIDSSRAEGPLRKAEDAREINTNECEVEDQINKVVHWAEEILAEKV